MTINNKSTKYSQLDYQHKDEIIMLVDDEPINTEIIQIHLEEMGYNNFIITNQPIKAIATIKKEKPSILLLALKMSGLSGFDILEAVRADEEIMNIPVIILTSSNDAETKLKALNLGASDLLSKPIDPSELVLRLRNTLMAKAYLGLSRTSNSNGIASIDPIKTIDDGNFTNGNKLVSSLSADNPRIRNLIERFILRLEERLDAMEHAYRKRDYATLASLAHWLKGTGGNVGFNDFTDPAQILEKFAKAEDESQIKEALSIIRRLASNVSMTDKKIDD